MKLFKSTNSLMAVVISSTFALFFLNGIGVMQNELLLLFIVFVPLLFYSTAYLFEKRRVVYMPALLVALFVVFIIGSFISLWQSVNIQNSFEQIILLSSLFFVFIFFFNYKHKFLRPLLHLIIFIGFIFIAAFLLFTFFPTQLSSHAPQDVFQLFYPYFSTHNNLGNYLILPFIISLLEFLEVRRKRYLLILVLIAPFILFSFARSAYVALFFVLIFIAITYWKKIHRRALILGCLITIFLLLTFFSLILTGDVVKSPFFQPFNKIFSSTIQNGTKDVIGKRDIYFKTALLGIADKPLFGYGPGNYHYVMQQHLSYDHMSSSHNIILDVFAEHGIAGGVLMILILVLFLKRRFQSFENKSDFIAYCLFLALFVNFQFTYTHKIFTMSFIFFALGGFFYEEKKQMRLDILIPILALSILSFIAFNKGISSLLLQKKAYKQSYIIYPLNKKVYEPLIESEINKGSYKNASAALGLYKNLFPGDKKVQYYIEQWSHDLDPTK